MGQLSRRIGRLIRAELNYSKHECATGNFGEGAAFVAGGAVAGVSVGKIGILAAGTGFSLGALPLSTAGALTGAALYEAIKAMVEGDSSSVAIATAGAVAGASVSAAIGSVGVAVGGTAFGVGMAPMAAAGAIAGLGIAGLNRLLQQGIDPEKLLELAVEDMHHDLAKLRKAVVPVIAAQKRIQQQYNQTQTELNKWQQRTQLALQKGDDNLARQALLRKKTHAEMASTLKAELDRQTAQVEKLKRHLVAFERKVFEAEANKAIIKARIAAAKAQAQLQMTTSHHSTAGTMAAFERMEEKVLEMEARSQAAYELIGNNLEEQFKLLESGSDVDDELAAMKAQLTDNVVLEQQKLSSLSHSAVDDELEALRRQIDNL